jgi:hypothetical protein
MECWSGGVLEKGSGGVLEKWSGGVLEWLLNRGASHGGYEGLTSVFCVLSSVLGLLSPYQSSSSSSSFSSSAVSSRQRLANIR